MGVKGLVVLGCFAVFAALGYYIMSKLDRFLDEVRQNNGARERAPSLTIATSCLSAIPSVSNALKDIRSRHPNARCSLSVGEEEEVIHSFDAGEADVVIVSAGAECSTPAQWEYITLSGQSFLLEGGAVEVRSATECSQQQKILWKKGARHSLAPEFIHQLLGQRR